MYSIYTGDIAAATNDIKGQIQYADDTLLWVKGKTRDELRKRIRDMTKELIPQLDEWGIKTNTGKTQFTVIAGKGRAGRRTSREVIKEGVTIDKVKVKGTETLKYLGQWITTNGNDKTNVEAAKTKMSMAWGMLMKLLKNPNLKKEVKVMIYSTLIRPAGFYGSALWDDPEERWIKNVAIQERKIPRQITGLYRRDDGRYYRNDVLYHEAGLKKRLNDEIKTSEERFSRRRLELPNVTYVEISREVTDRLTRFSET